MKLFSYSALILFVFCAFVNCRFMFREVGFLRSSVYPPEMSMKGGLGSNTPGKTFDHSAFDKLLKAYVDEKGNVAYGRLKKDAEPRLNAYLESLSKVKEAELSRYERLALRINAYNAFTLKLLIENIGVNSIKDIPGSKRWDGKRWNLGGTRVSLNQLEHEMVRREFNEPRIHFALVCAAFSCPFLRQDAYSGNNLRELLEDQSRLFFKEKRNLIWDKEKSELHITDLLDWYRKDFVSHSGSLLAFILPYMSKKEAQEIKAAGNNLKIKWIEYDWKLNGSW